MTTKLEQPIYLDYQASTPIDPRVLEAMLPFMKDKFGNPHSSEHFFGWQSNEALELALNQIADYLDVLSDEIILTSGATESNNLAIIGLGYAALQKSKKRTFLISSIEHKCVLGSSRFLQNFGFNVQKIPVDDTGIINLNKLKEMMNDDVLLVSTMAVNNEIGTVEPLEEISKIVKQYDAIFHVDAAQAGYLDIDINKSQIDLLSISSHKIYGPKGIGALYINSNSLLKPSPIIYGGGQQNGYRSGTIPTFLAIGFGKACEIMKQVRNEEKQQIQALRNELKNGLEQIIPGIKFNGTFENRHPGNLNCTLPNENAKSFIYKFQPNLAFSTGSACSSGEIEPSHVLKAIGLSTEEAENSFRISIGRYTKIEEIHLTLQLLTHLKENGN